MVYNRSLVHPESPRTDIRNVAVDATRIAGDLGSALVANMVMLGAYLKYRATVSIESVERGLAEVLKGKREDLVSLNLRALALGAEECELVDNVDMV